MLKISKIHCLQETFFYKNVEGAKGHYKHPKNVPWL